MAERQQWWQCRQRQQWVKVVAAACACVQLLLAPRAVVATEAAHCVCACLLKQPPSRVWGPLSVSPFSCVFLSSVQSGTSCDGLGLKMAAANKLVPPLASFLGQTRRDRGVYLQPCGAARAAGNICRIRLGAVLCWQRP